MMKPERAARLSDLVVLPHLSPRSRLIVVRRIARESQAQWEETRFFFDRELEEARAGHPFTARKLESVKVLRRQARDQHAKTLHHIGEWLYENDALLTALYGFDGICDVLEVNPTHRPEVLEYADNKVRAISAVAFVSGLEESASRQSGRRRPDFKDGPLFKVFLEMVMKLMKDKPGCMPDPTVPGGPLYGVPTYTRQPDGSMVMNTPAITVHSATGSKVVKSKPGRARKPVMPSKVATLFVAQHRDQEEEAANV